MTTSEIRAAGHHESSARPVARTVAAGLRRRPRSVIVVGDPRLTAALPVDRRRVTRYLAPEDVNPAHRAELLLDEEGLAAIKASRPDILFAFRALWLCRTTAAGHIELVGGGRPFSNVLNRRQLVMKSALDRVLGALGLVIALPVMLAAALWIRVDSRGPALFVQSRVGLNGRVFQFYKLRTMRQGNDPEQHRSFMRAQILREAGAASAFFKLTADPRVTRPGQLLRKLSLDELPQLWNVVKGDLSLVGPRPPLLEEALLYDAHTWQRQRVKPGITGLWQVSGRSRIGFPEMVDLDVAYWRNWSLRQELRILVRTPIAALVERDTA